MGQICLKDIESNSNLDQPYLWVSIFYLLHFICIFIIHTYYPYIFSNLDNKLKLNFLLFLILLQLIFFSEDGFYIFYYTSYCCTWWETWEVHWDSSQEVTTKNVVLPYNSESCSGPIWGWPYVKGGWNR